MRKVLIFGTLGVIFSLLLAPFGHAEQTRIRYLTWETSFEQIALTRKIIAAFEEQNPDIKIQFEASSDATRIFLTDAAAGTSPDVMYITNEFMPQMIEKGILLPLDDLIERDGIDMSAFLPKTVEDLTFHGKLYAYPIHFSTSMLFYNKQMFDEQGIPYPDETWTWETYRDTADKLTQVRQDTGRIEVFGALVPDYQILIGGFGGRIFDENDRCVANSPENIEAIRFGVSMMGKQAPTSAQAMDTTDMQLFSNGRLAMFIGRTWQLPQLIQHMGDTPWDVAPVPKFRRRYSLFAVGGNCIASDTRNQEAAWKFVKFYSSVEGQKLLGLQKNCTPALKELAYSPEHFLSPPPPSIHLFIEAADYSDKLVPDRPWSVEFGSRVWSLTERIKADPRRFPPEQVLAEVEQQGNELLDRLRREQEHIARLALRDEPPTAFLLRFMLILMGIAAVVIIFIARRNRRYWEGYLFIAPWLIGFILFSLGPVLVSLYLSFCRYDLMLPPQWTGLDNIRRLFADPLFFKSLFNTLYYSVFTVPLQLTFALILAMLLNTRIRGTNFFRSVYYLPALTSGVAICLLWRWIYSPELGLFNMFLGFFGISGPDWLTSPTWAMPAIIIMSVWASLGGPMLIFLAGLQGIPLHLYEASELDGANRWQTFCNVTLPMLSPSMFFNLVMAVIASFQVFTTVFVMTSNTAASIEPGGPAHSTMVYVLYLYQTGFRYLDMGKACAMAWILFLIIMCLTLVNFMISKRWVHYDQV